MKSPKQYLSIIRAQPSPWRFVVSRVMRLAGISHLITMTVHPGIRLRLYPTSLSEMYWMNADARRDDHTILQAWLTGGMTVVDVGANIGALTIHASQAVGYTGRVISIEAHPRIYDYLVGNLRLNSCTNVRAVLTAVGASEGSLVFSDLKQDDENHVVTKEGGSIPDPGRYETALSGGVEVPVQTLDSLLDGASVDLLKIDVEGFELPVLQGAQETLAHTAFLYIESFERSFAEYGYHTRDVVDLLVGHGFALFSRQSGAWTSIGLDHVSVTVENLVALRDPELIDRLAVA